MRRMEGLMVFTFMCILLIMVICNHCEDTGGGGGGNEGSPSPTPAVSPTPTPPDTDYPVLKGTSWYFEFRFNDPGAPYHGNIAAYGEYYITGQQGGSFVGNGSVYTVLQEWFNLVGTIDTTGKFEMEWIINSVAGTNFQFTNGKYSVNSMKADVNWGWPNARMNATRR
jgi:hypothetical protein